MRKKEGKMGWFYPKRRGGAERKQQGCTSQTVTPYSLSPTLHLLMIFGIVISLLWLSHYTDYKAQSQHTAINFQLFLLMSPILLILFLIAYSTSGRLNFHFTCSKHESPSIDHLGRRGVWSPSPQAPGMW